MYIYIHIYKNMSKYVLDYRLEIRDILLVEDLMDYSEQFCVNRCVACEFFFLSVPF